MDFYFEIGLTIILKLLRERKNLKPYYKALKKLKVALDQLTDDDANFRAMFTPESKEQ